MGIFVPLVIVTAAGQNAPGIEPLGLVSAFWGILVGAIAYAILRRRPARSPPSVPAR
ncbi:hypothetical protein [Kocuria sp.]|uniref:hypothetical protein n=1 Tax=Kocuria sp. TaxID=1871328 RepID=UPI00289BFC4F|nr:hypothetical protein [Kocuria sp.]